MRFDDKMTQPGEAVAISMGMRYADDFGMLKAKGEFIFDLRDLDGNQLHYFKKTNLIVLDAGIHAARLFKDNAEPNFGAYMLAVGTGASGALLSPNSPDPRQRKLNAEIERKTFASTTFRDTLGVASAIPTNIVDFTTQFIEGEAAGPLNEMGIISPISANPSTTNPNPDTFPTRDVTVDVSQYDILLNYLPFAVVAKPSASRLTITWRLTF